MNLDDSKLVYKFMGKSGEVETDVSAYPEDPEFTAEIVKYELSFYVANHPRELEWRNKELAATDYMFVPDATYGGVSIAESDRLEDILAYRKSLRDYAYKTNQPRPERPEWFKES